MNRSDDSGNLSRFSIFRPIVEPLTVSITKFIEELLIYFSQRVDDKDLTQEQYEDRLAIAKTIIGEAGGRTQYTDWKQGQEAVSWIIINRYNDKNYENDWSSVVTAEGQFKGYNLGESRYKNGKCDAIAWDYAYHLAGCMVTGHYD